jgi:hypothetical protein
MNLKNRTEKMGKNDPPRPMMHRRIAGSISREVETGKEELGMIR